MFLEHNRLSRKLYVSLDFDDDFDALDLRNMILFLCYYKLPNKHLFTCSRATRETLEKVGNMFQINTKNT